MNEFAAIFDWDGVVIDSSAQHERSWELLAEEIQRPLPKNHFILGFGKKNQLIIPTILKWSQDEAEIEAFGNRKEELYRELVRDHGVEVLPGARELLIALKEAGIPRAVGSSTPRNNLDAIFAVTGLGEYFDAVVSANDVVHGKPAPDVFLKAAGFLGVEPARCVVFEDALFGIEAAQRAGMKVVGVATTNPPELLGHADDVVSTLAQVDLPRLQRLFPASVKVAG
jgi:beta-phosphoglucomutase family hydrolase